MKPDYSSIKDFSSARKKEIYKMVKQAELSSERATICLLTTGEVIRFGNDIYT